MNLEQAVVDAVGKMAGRKNGAVIIGMSFMYLMKDMGWQILAMVAGLAGLVVALQWVLDLYEVYKVGTREPENGNGTHPEQPTGA